MHISQIIFAETPFLNGSITIIHVSKNVWCFSLWVFRAPTNSEDVVSMGCLVLNTATHKCHSHSTFKHVWFILPFNKGVVSTKRWFVMFVICKVCLYFSFLQFPSFKAQLIGEIPQQFIALIIFLTGFR